MAFLGLTLLLATSSVNAAVTSEQSDGQITLLNKGEPVLTYHMDTAVPPDGVEKHYKRSGFIHPLYSPNGKILTDDFPIGHVHQHAVFSAWTRATFKHEVVDFWNQHAQLGTANHVELESVEEDSFSAKIQQVSLKNGPAIDEKWNVSVSPSPSPFIIDIKIEQKCATNDEIYFHPYHYGGFGFRGSAHWSSEDKERYEGSMHVLTSEGIVDVESSNHTRPNWIAVYGKIHGKHAGFVVMNHPSNFRSPQPIRVHPRMPYFVFTPPVSGSFILKPGFTYSAQYRIVTFDGTPDEKKIEKWYRDYTGKSTD
ncbi:MAG: hypothetical protein CMI18_05865 [Opitutaceae bacterium]|nr:hypothetical protein [Opitutaceae bacterium]|tara:strand:+ start:910 stop:1839 length:930 start_codon:yes stop_codon:yes gene_type:complete